MNQAAVHALRKLGGWGLGWVLIASLSACAMQNPFRAYTPAGSTANSESTPTLEQKKNLPRSAELRTQLASELYARGLIREALAELDNALRSNPRYAPALGLRGLAFAQLGNYTQADDSFQAALKIAADDPDIQHNYGWFLCQQRRYVDADRAFRTALSIPAYPTPAKTWLAIGTCAKTAGNLAESYAALLHAKNLDANNPTLAYEMADVMHNMGREAEAKRWIAVLNSNDESTTPATLDLGARIEQALGNREAAIDLLKKLNQRFPNSPEAARYR